MDNKSILQNSNSQIGNNNVTKLKKINQLKFNKKSKIFFNINYQNAYNSINEIYLPLIQNLESISSLKSNTESTLACIEFFSNHDSIFELINSNEEKNSINDNTISDLMNELKIFEIIELSLILFIIHIILEVKIEYIDNFNEDDIVSIYQNCLDVIKKLYEIIILISILIIQVISVKNFLKMKQRLIIMNK